MSYAGKSHAHRDEKNDYSRLDERNIVEKELEDMEEGCDILDYAQDIAIHEYERGVKESGI